MQNRGQYMANTVFRSSFKASYRVLKCTETSLDDYQMADVALLFCNLTVLADFARQLLSLHKLLNTLVGPYPFARKNKLMSFVT